MTTLREAAQMALDALNSSVPFGWSTSYVDKHRLAIEALRAALAQPPCATGSQCVGNKCECCVVQEREWQGLTDDEMMMIYGQSHEGKKYSLGRAIEAKLKEKNT